MKKQIIRRYLAFLFAVVLLIAGGLAIFRPFSYEVPFAQSDVKSVSFYWDYDKMQKKVVHTQEEIALLYTSLSEISLRGPYKRLPAGGQSFYLAFHLEDGTDWICTFCQAGHYGQGYFADNNRQMKIANFNLEQLWDQIEQPASSTVGDLQNELSAPSLTSK